jgi:hypothetical protein
MNNNITYYRITKIRRRKRHERLINIDTQELANPNAEIIAINWNNRSAYLNNQWWTLQDWNNHEHTYHIRIRKQKP